MGVIGSSSRCNRSGSSGCNGSSNGCFVYLCNRCCSSSGCFVGVVVEIDQCFVGVDIEKVINCCHLIC